MNNPHLRNGKFCITSAPENVQVILDDWIKYHGEEISELLSRFGVDAAHVGLPEWQMLCTDSHD